MNFIKHLTFDIGHWTFQNGFTLVELLVVSAVSALIGAAVLGLVVNNSGVFYTETAKVNQGLNTNDTLASIKGNIKLSDGVVESFLSGGNTYTSNDSSIVLRLLSVDSSGSPIPGSFDHFVYQKSGDKIRLLIFPSQNSDRKSADQILASNVDLLIFNYYDATGAEITPAQAVKVQATLKLKQKAGMDTEVNVATTEASLRNN